jgi:hypothetical protein
VVQAIKPNGRSIQVAVLTDDTQRAASEIVRLLLLQAKRPGRAVEASFPGIKSASDFHPKTRI